MNVSSYSSNSSLSSVLRMSARSNSYHNGVTGWVKMGGTGSKNSSSTSSSSNVSSASQNYMSSLKEFGGKINSALSSLTGQGESTIFDMLKATSTDADAVNVKINDQEKASVFNAAGSGKKTLEVQQLASKQKNSGTMFKSAAVSDVKTGSNSFSIEKGGKEHPFSVSVNETDSNRTVQEKMAAAINKENIGVKASVVYNEKDKTSSIVLSANESGTKEAFEIKDTGGGDIVEKMGAANTANEAQDAEYTLDGKKQTSSKNEVDLGDGITAEFKKVTEKEVTVKAENDTDDVTNAVYDLVNGFNQLREAALNSDDSGAVRLQNKLDSASSAYLATLNRAGVTFNNDGYLQIDKEKLAASIENGQAEKIFGENSGFARSLSSVAKQAESDPGRFLSVEARTGQDQAKEEEAEQDYFDLLDSANFNSYQNAQLLRYENAYMLLNAFA